MNNRTDITDLRSALALLAETPGELVETDVPVEPMAELAGVYRYVGAGGTVQRPTKVNGPAMIFNNVNGHPDDRVLIGLLSSRARVGRMLGCEPDRLGHLLGECAGRPLEPVVKEGPAPCQEVVHRAEEEDFDLFRLIPAPTNTPDDAGPYIRCV